MRRRKQHRYPGQTLIEPGPAAHRGNDTDFGTPISVTQIMVMVASRMLVSAPSRITCSTGAWKKIDVPKSPHATFPNHLKY